MDRARVHPFTRLAAFVALCGSLCVAGAARAAEEGDPLRQKALKLNEITGTDVMDGYFRALVKDEAGTRKLLAVAVKMAKEKEQPFNYNAAFVLARTAQQLKDFSASQAFYKICSDQAFKLQSADKLIQVYDGLIDLFYQNNKFDEAIKACQEFLDLKPKGRNDPINRIKPFVMERMIQAMAKKGKIAEALKLTDELVKADEDGWYFLQLKGWVQREAGKLDDATKTYLEVIDRLKKNKEMEAPQRERYTDRVRYLLSGLYVDMGQIDKAADQLKVLLKKKPDDPTFNNDLGFIWADHDMNLDEAEKLIRKAIDLDRKQRKENPELTPDEDRDNPAYLDSLGWVLYKKKDYKEAKKHLQEAIKQKEGVHVEILDHLAEVQLALGEKDEAIATWKKALELETPTKRDQQRKEAIEKKLKKVLASK